MKVLPYLTSLLIFISCSSAPKTGFENPLHNYDSALSLAKKNKKNVIILFDYLSSNHANEYNSILNNKKLIELSENFIYVRLFLDDRTFDTINQRYVGRHNQHIFDSFKTNIDIPCFIFLDLKAKSNSDAINISSSYDSDILINYLNKYKGS